MAAKKVFISYSHDSPEHAARVAGLAASLRRDGVDCRIDLDVAGSPKEGWRTWMKRSLKWADRVLVVCTKTYLRRLLKEEERGKGYGATYEANLIAQELYEAHLVNERFIPVIFEERDRRHVPAELRDFTVYLLEDQKLYERLYATITDQHRPKRGLGPVKKVSLPEASPLFNEAGEEAVAAARAALKAPKLKKATDPPYPDQPYPLLRPYTHPELFAGRERDLDMLERLLADNIPVLGLYSTSGAGKSSLLGAGLAPRLRKLGWPVAYTAYPKDRHLAKRLLEAMLEWEGGKTVSDDDPDAFREAVRTAHDLSGRPVVLVLDQFEEVMDPGNDETGKRIGRLVAATIEEQPFCRWVLSYRHEYHGRVEEWLQDAFRCADVTWRGRFRTYPLKPLGDADSIEVSTQAFLAAITAPLRIKDEAGGPRYELSFSEGGAERLAAAFARARTEQAKAPLLPELQVVLAHLIKESKTAEIQVPEPLDKLIAGALADHLRRAIEDVAESPARRAEVLLALRDLATDDGKRSEGRTAQELEGALDAGILKKLGDEYRVLYRERREGRDYFLLSHDRIAEAVLGEMANPRNKEWLDAELIALRPLVSAKAALLNHDPVEATGMSTENFRRIATHAKALLWDETRKEWWAACVQRNQARIADLEAGLSGHGRPDRALEILDELSDLGLGRPELAGLLEKRPDLANVFEEGPARVSERRRNAVVLAAADCCARFLPVRVKKDLDSYAPAIGALLWALDYGPMRDAEATVVDQAGEIRRLIVGSLRERSPGLPQLADDDWALIPGGTFRMGSEASGAWPDESPVHTVEVRSFRLLKHQVTNAEFAALFGGRWANEAASKPRHPAAAMTWYQAYVYAAWLGGRLPTEAEWEYAARSGGKDRRYPWGDSTRGIHQRAVVKSFWRSPFRSGPMTVGSKPKGDTDQGVGDMAGNVWEWVADWYRNYTGETQIDPWGPITGGDRALRGGSFDDDATFARVSNRLRWHPVVWDDVLGFRVLVAAAPEDGS